MTTTPDFRSFTHFGMASTRLYKLTTPYLKKLAELFKINPILNFSQCVDTSNPNNALNILNFKYSPYEDQKWIMILYLQNEISTFNLELLRDALSTKPLDDEKLKAVINARSCLKTISTTSTIQHKHALLAINFLESKMDIDSEHHINSLISIANESTNTELSSDQLVQIENAIIVWMKEPRYNRAVEFQSSLHQLLLNCKKEHKFRVTMYYHDFLQKFAHDYSRWRDPRPAIAQKIVSAISESLPNLGKEGTILRNMLLGALVANIPTENNNPIEEVSTLTNSLFLLREFTETGLLNDLKNDPSLAAIVDRVQKLLNHQNKHIVNYSLHALNAIFTNDLLNDLKYAKTIKNVASCSQLLLNHDELPILVSSLKLLGNVKNPELLTNQSEPALVDLVKKLQIFLGHGIIDTVLNSSYLLANLLNAGLHEKIESKLLQSIMDEALKLLKHTDPIARANALTILDCYIRADADINFIQNNLISITHNIQESLNHKDTTMITNAITLLMHLYSNDLLKNRNLVLQQALMKKIIEHLNHNDPEVKAKSLYFFSKLVELNHCDNLLQPFFPDILNQAQAFLSHEHVNIVNNSLCIIARTLMKGLTANLESNLSTSLVSKVLILFDHKSQMIVSNVFSLLRQLIKIDSYKDILKKNSISLVNKVLPLLQRRDNKIAADSLHLLGLLFQKDIFNAPNDKQLVEALSNVTIDALKTPSITLSILNDVIESLLDGNLFSYLNPTMQSNLTALLKTMSKNQPEDITQKTLQLLQRINQPHHPKSGGD